MVRPRCPGGGAAFSCACALCSIDRRPCKKICLCSAPRIRLHSRTMSQARKSHSLSGAEARRIWLRAQRLDAPAPFGEGAQATAAAVEHLGYVQIDTINVIERSHHHILWTRIPKYRRTNLRQAQIVDKSVFGYWTHAVSYVSTQSIRLFTHAM